MPYKDHRLIHASLEKMVENGVLTSAVLFGQSAPNWRVRYDDAQGNNQDVFLHSENEASVFLSGLAAAQAHASRDTVS